MGDGLKRAALAALCSRGPWATSTLDATTRRYVACSLTGGDLALLFELISAGRTDYHAAVGALSASDRKCDRAFQLLRKAGLIEYTGTPKRWRVVGEVAS